MALESFSGSFMGTSGPYCPSIRISRGPLGQSVEITGVPVPGASISTVGNPSNDEERTNTLDRLRNGKGFSLNPIRAISSEYFESLARDSRRSLSFPSPIMASRHWIFDRTKSKDSIKSGKFFCFTRRPTPRITGGCPCWNHGCSTGSRDRWIISSSKTGLNMVVTSSEEIPVREQKSSLTPSETATIRSQWG